MSSRRQRKINSDITEGNLRKSFWKLSLPLMAGALLQDMFTLADLFFVGRLGHVAVAALSMSGVIIAVMIMVAMGISSGTTALIAHFIGKKDYDSADNVLFQTGILSIVCSLGMMIIGFFGTSGLLQIFGASPEIISAASGYLKISFIFSIFIFLFIGFSQALRGSGDVVFPLKVLIFANILNIILDPLFIFGIGFFPRMEVAGSALATVISSALSVVIILTHLIFGHSSLHFHKGIFKINLPVIGRMVRIGFFASVEVLLRQISFLLLLRLVSSFGAAALAAYGIALRLRMCVMMLGFGMGSACAVLIGQNMGAAQPARAAQSGWNALKYYEFIAIPAAVVFFIFAGPIIGVFNDYSEVVKTGAVLLQFIAVTLPFLSLALILGRGISGAGDTIAPAVITGISQLGLRVPVSYIMTLGFGLGANGIWLGINVSDICHGLAMVWYFRKGIWQKRYHRHRAILEEVSLAAV